MAVVETTLLAGYTLGNGHTALFVTRVFNDPGYTYTLADNEIRLYTSISDAGVAGEDIRRFITEFGNSQLLAIPAGAIVSALVWQMRTDARGGAGDDTIAPCGTDGLGAIDDGGPQPGDQAMFDAVATGVSYGAAVSFTLPIYYSFNLNAVAITAFQVALDAYWLDPASYSYFQIGGKQAVENGADRTTRYTQTEALPCKLVVTYTPPDTGKRRIFFTNPPAMCDRKLFGGTVF